MPTIERDTGWRKRQLLILLVLLCAMAALCALMQPLSTSHAQGSVTIVFTPLTWEISGLDGDADNFGPGAGDVGSYIGAELCPVNGDATDLTAELQLPSGSPLAITGSPTQTIDTLTIDCAEVYFSVRVPRSAITTTQAYTLQVTGSDLVAPQILTGTLDLVNFRGVPPGSGADELNGPGTVTVGEIYEYTATAGLALTNVEQLVHQIDFPTDQFAILDVQHAINPPPASTVNTDEIYIDACGWLSNTNSCSITGITPLSGTSIITYTVQVLEEGTATLTHSLFGYAPDPNNNFFYQDLVDTLSVSASAPPITTTPVVTLTQTSVAATATHIAGLTATSVAGTQTAVASITVTTTPVVTATQTAAVQQTQTAQVQQTQTAIVRLTQTAAAGQADIEIDYDVSPSQAQVGQNVTFTARINNDGPGQSLDTTLTSSFSTYLDIRSVTTTQGSYSINTSTRTVTVNVGNIPADRTVTVTIVTQVNSTLRTTTTVSNSAVLRYREGNVNRQVNSNTVSVRLIGSTTLPNTGGMQIERQEAPRLYLPAMITAVLLGLAGAASALYGYRTRLTRPLWADWYLKTGLMLMAVGLVFGVVARTFLPGESEPPSSVAQAPTAPQATPSPTGDWLSSEEDEPLEMWWPTSTPEPEVLPDYPIPTPSVVPTDAGPEPDTSAVTQIVIPQLELNTIVKYVPFDGLSWMIAGLQNEIAWLGETSWPGLGGNTALAGHVTLRNGARGPFYGLETLEDDAEIILYTEKNVYYYRVSEKRQAEDTDLSAVAAADNSVLTLITCADWDNDAKFYRKRYLVRAELVDVRARTDNTVASVP